MAHKTTSAVFCKGGFWWCLLLLASSSMVSAFPVRRSLNPVAVLDAVQKDVCNAGRSDLLNLYNSSHEDYASASQDGAPTAGPFNREDGTSSLY